MEILEMTTRSTRHSVQPKTTGIDIKNNAQSDVDYSGSFDLTKKLLVIDTDGEFLQNSRSKKKGPTPRYYLHKFLKRVYKYYNIVLWSSGSMKSLEAEMESLGIFRTDDYKISLTLDRQSLTNAGVFPESVKLVKHPVVIWKKFPGTYSNRNTVIISEDTRELDKCKTDDKLRRLSEYLEVISGLTDFRTLNHAEWEETRRMYRESSLDEYEAACKEMIRSYRVKELNPLRTGKKLLVLDIDQTIFSVKDNEPWKRPYLDEFLTRAYSHYDIAIWSARSMSGIEIVMTWLGLTRKEEYRIAFLVDCEAMISVRVANVVAKVKPLDVIWGIFPQFSARDTVMIDDQRVNFLMNMSSGLQIEGFPGADEDPREDRELMELAEYLELIAMSGDFEELNHQKWKEYCH